MLSNIPLGSMVKGGRCLICLQSRSCFYVHKLASEQCAHASRHKTLLNGSMRYNCAVRRAQVLL